MGAPAPMTSVLSLTYKLPVLIAVLCGLPKQGLSRSYATLVPELVEVLTCSKLSIIFVGGGDRSNI